MAVLRRYGRLNDALAVIIGPGRTFLVPIWGHRSVSGDEIPPELVEVDRVLRALRPAVTVENGLVTARFEPQPEHRGNAGWLHGGLAAVVLDHVCARAAADALGARVVTGRLDLRYPKPVLLAAGPYLVEARAERARGRMVRVNGAIVGDDGGTMVEARSLFVVMP